MPWRRVQFGALIDADGLGVGPCQLGEFANEQKPILGRLVARLIHSTDPIMLMFHALSPP